MQELNELIQKFCDFNSITKDQLLIKSRKREFIEKRVVIINVLREKRFTFEAIGEAFDLDHSTIIYHTKDFDFIKKHNLELRDLYNSFNDSFKSVSNLS